MPFDPEFDDSSSAGTNVSDVLRTQGTNNAITVGVTAVEAKVGGSRLAGRKLLVISPLDNDVYWGFRSDVTTANGFPIAKLQVAIFSVDDSIAVYLIAAGAGKSVVMGES